MKNLKYVFVLICFLSIPAFVNAYYSEEQFRTDIMDSIRYNTQKQAVQDIMDSGNKSYQQSFDTYYQTTNNLKNELDLQLKELQMKQDAQDRADAWQKEKAVLDQQLDLINQRKELEAQQAAFEQEKRSQDLIQSAKDAVEKTHRESDPEETSSTVPIIPASPGGNSNNPFAGILTSDSATPAGVVSNPYAKNFAPSPNQNQPAKATSLPKKLYILPTNIISIQADATSTQTLPITVPKKSIFQRFLSKIFSFF